MTYRIIWQRAREGAYATSPQGWYAAWADLIRASYAPIIRPLLMMVILGYGVERIPPGRFG